MAETVYYVDTDVVGGAGDGSSWANAYASLNTAEQARDADITGGNAVAFNCRGVTLADTAAVNVLGWTTDVDSYVRIYTEQANRHSGKWDTAKYRLSVAGATPLQLGEDYVRVEGVQVETTDATASQKVVSMGAVAATNNYTRVANCIARTYTDTTTFAVPYYFSSANAIVDFWNCVAHHRGDTAATSDNGFTFTVAVANAYNCTSVGGKYGFRCTGGTIVWTNCLGYGTATADFYATTVTPVVTYCLSEDATADDWGGAGNLINKTVTFVGTAATDFHLHADDVSGAKDGGLDLSATFTDDIDGVTRPTGTGTWDIGADEYVAAGGTAYDGSATLALSAALARESVVGLFGAASLPSVGAILAASLVGYGGSGAFSVGATAGPGEGGLGLFGAGALPSAGALTAASQAGFLGAGTLNAISALDAESLHAALASALFGTSADFVASRAEVTAWLATVALAVAADLPAGGMLSAQGTAVLAQIASLDAAARADLLGMAALGILAETQSASMQAAAVTAALAILSAVGAQSQAGITGTALLAAALALTASNQPTVAALIIEWLAETLTSAGVSAERLTSPAVSGDTLRPS